MRLNQIIHPLSGNCWPQNNACQDVIWRNGQTGTFSKLAKDYQNVAECKTHQLSRVAKPKVRKRGKKHIKSIDSVYSVDHGEEHGAEVVGEVWNDELAVPEADLLAGELHQAPERLDGQRQIAERKSTF